MKKIFTVITLLVFLKNYSQQINTMISSGWDMSLYCAISPNNKYVAKMDKMKATIWDFKTGRLVREIIFTTTPLSNYVKENVPDSISFSSNDNSVFIYKCGALYPGENATKSATITEISIETGIAGKEELNLKPVRNIDSINTNLILKVISSNKEFSYSSPNGKNEVVYQNTSADGGLILNIYIKKNGVLSKVLGHPMCINYAFSSDSRYLFANGFIYDFLLDKKICELKSVPFIPFGCGFLNNSNTLYTAAKDEIIIWDLPDIKRLKTPDLLSSINSNNGEYLAYATGDLQYESKQGYVINLITKEKVGKPVQFHPNEFEQIKDVSDDGKYLLTISPKGNRIYNCATGELIRHFPEYRMNTAFFLNNSEVTNYDVSKGTPGEIMRYNIFTDKNEPFDIKEMLPLGKHEAIISLTRLKKDHLLVSTWAGEKKINIYILNIETKDVDKLTTTTELIVAESSKMSKDNNLVAFNMGGTKIGVFNKKTKKTIELNQFSYISNFAFSSDGKHLISSLVDGTSKYWDLETGKEIASIISTGYQEYVITTPEQYYMSTKGAAEYVHFVKGNNLYGVEQFDLKYNRPDLVLKKMGLGNEKVIEAYHKAYLKRLKKMKLTEDMLSDELNLPEIKIKNSEQISSIQNESVLKINLEVLDKKYNLDRINIWINDVALYGTKGISIKSKNALNYETDLTIDLKKGINNIQFSVLNIAGAESYKESVTVNCTKGKEKPDLYLLCIGSGEFIQKEFNLTYASKDAMDIKQMLSTNKNYGRVYTKTLTNKEVTKNNVILLKDFLKTADRNDEVILFYAGHGVLDKDLDYYLSSGDIDFTNPSAKGIPYEVLENILDSIAPLKKILLIDACHSGEIDKEEVQVTASDKPNSGITFRNVGTAIAQKDSYLGLENTSELTKTLFTDLRKGTGATVISSAGGKEYAMESGQWKNGLFTYCLLRGLKDNTADLNKDGQIMLSELQQYLTTEVSNLSNGAQQPTSRIENISADFRIW
ncbi:MAG: hypothetical protein K0S33_361 [Bacteroidetes bacterium]|jgi:WD40 repeat protein|nr:hypothetical protein [Bacteroidota bacterium]